MARFKNFRCASSPYWYVAKKIILWRAGTIYKNVLLGIGNPQGTHAEIYVNQLLQICLDKFCSAHLSELSIVGGMLRVALIQVYSGIDKAGTFFFMMKPFLHLDSQNQTQSVRQMIFGRIASGKRIAIPRAYHDISQKRSAYAESGYHYSSKACHYSKRQPVCFDLEKNTLWLPYSLNLNLISILFTKEFKRDVLKSSYHQQQYIWHLKREKETCSFYIFIFFSRCWGNLRRVTGLILYLQEVQDDSASFAVCAALPYFSHLCYHGAETLNSFSVLRF